MPAIFNYQGKLSDASGTPRNAPAVMVFRIYDGASGGALLTTYTPSSLVPVINGVFNVLIGDTAPGVGTLSAPLTGALSGAGSRYLEVEVDGTTLSPRQRLLAVPYAMSVADGSITDASVAAAAGVAYSKLNLGNSIVNADVNAAAGIVYSKLSLANSVVNADLASGTFGNITGLGAQSQNLNMNAHRITGVTNPTAPQDAASKAYVDTATTTLAGVTISGGGILSGGGDLTANRTISLNLDNTAACLTAGCKVYWNGTQLVTGTDNSAGAGTVTGTGSANRVVKFTAAGSNVGDSIITDNGTTVSVAGNMTLTGNVGAAGAGATWDGATIGANRGGTGATTLTSGGILLGNGTGAVTATGVLTNGQLLIGDGAGAPAAATLTGTANQVSVVNGAGTITLSAPQNIHAGASPTFAGMTFSGFNSCSALETDASGDLVCGSDDTGAGGTITGTGTNNRIPLWTGGASLGSLAAGTAGQLLQSNGAAAPSWLNAGSVNTAGSVVMRDGSGSFSAGTVTATFSGNGSALTNLDADNVASGTLAVARGGTGAGTLTAGGLLLGNGTGAVTATGVLTNGQLLIGDGVGAPSAATLTGTANRVTVSNGAGTITLNGPQDIHAGASPTFAGMTLNGFANCAVETDASGDLVCGSDDTGAGGTITGTGTNNRIPLWTGGASLGSLAAGTAGQLLQSNGGAAPGWLTSASANTAGAVVVRDGSGNFAAGTISAAFSGDGSALTSLDAGDISAGTLAIARGGTGAGLADPNADRLLFWDDSATSSAWLTLGTGLSITGTTINAAGAALTNDSVTAAHIAQGTAGQLLMSNATPDTAWTSMTGDVTISGAGVTTIANDAVAAANITQGAAGQFLMSNATPDTAWTSMTGDVTLSATGVTTIANDAVVAANITQGTAGQILMTNGTPDAAWASMTGDVTISAAGVTTIANDAAALGTNTTGNYVASVAAASANSGITVTGTAGEGWSPSLAVSGLSATACNSATQKIVWSGTAFGCGTDATGSGGDPDGADDVLLQAATPGTAQTGNLNITGAGLFGGNVVLNTAASSVVMRESVGNTFNATLDAGDLTANRTFTLPNTGGNLLVGGANPGTGTFAIPVWSTAGLVLGSSIMNQFSDVAGTKILVAGPMGVGGANPIGSTGLSVGGDTEISGDLEVAGRATIGGTGHPNSKLYVLNQTGTAAVEAETTFTGAGNHYGVYASASAAQSGFSSMGIYATAAAGAGASWAGYFAGDTQTTGAVRIGTNASSGWTNERLTINDSTNSNSWTGVSLRGGIPFYAYMTPSGSGAYHYYQTASNNIIFSVPIQATIASDRRMKKNILPLASVLDRLSLMPAVTYEYINGTKYGSGVLKGFIAQDVEKAFPEWVFTDDDGYKKIRFQGFEAVTVEAMMELKKKNEELERRIAALEKLLK